MQRVVWLQIGFILSVLVGGEGLLLFFPSPYQIKAAVHGLSSVLAIATSTYLVHRIYPVLRGAKAAWSALPNWLIAAVATNLAAAISGNWIYMRYRGEGGPRAWILANAPGFHNVLMEFKEFISLFPCFLLTVAVFCAYYYGEQVMRRRELSQFFVALILAAWIFALIGWMSGLTLAKLRFV
ncbi:MAG: hypothetical protein N3A55_03575 [Methylohalobius sp.]|nr:hypothetical protein [Methylohalobius sp.]